MKTLRNRGEVSVLMLVVMMVACHLLMGGMNHGNKEHDMNNAKNTSAASYAKDPVCGMAVEISTGSFQSAWNTKTYYFCSKEDKDKFELKPDEYVK